MFIVVSYDIPDDKRRTKVAKALEGYGTRVQYSVFEVNLDARHVTRMRAELGKLASPKADSIRFYTLCQACYNQISVLGVGRPAEKPPEAVII
jgi:CRISPR-associated protein Cas2